MCMLREYKTYGSCAEWLGGTEVQAGGREKGQVGVKRKKNSENNGPKLALQWLKNMEDKEVWQIEYVTKKEE